MAARPETKVGPPIKRPPMKISEIAEMIVEIRSMTEDALDILKHRYGIVRPPIRIHRTRKRQFLKLVELMGKNPRPSQASAIRAAIRACPGKEDDPGYTFASLKRYMESKPEYFE